MKNILITGSARGIGRAIAELAHSQGYKVIVHGAKETDELTEVNNKLEGSIKSYFDIANKDATHNAIYNLINEVGTIDVLVNNAGASMNCSLNDVSEVDDEKAMIEYRVNVLGIIHCVQAVIPKMLEKGSGSIINIASFKGYPSYSTMSSLTYSASKAGVLSVTKSLAKTYSDKGIRINAVSPGYTRTDMSKDWPQDAWERINNGILLNRLAEPAEIAKMVMFLASDDASYITGADYLVDGGYSLKGK